MKYVLICISFCLSFFNLVAQTTEIENLKQSLQKEKTDTGRVSLLNELCFKLHETKPDTALSLALEALTLSREIGFEKGEAASLNRVSIVYITLGNYVKALELQLDAIKINEKINNLDGLHRNYNNIGVIYREQEDHRLALDYFFKAKPIMEKLQDKQALAGTLSNIGRSYFALKIYDSARLYANLAYETALRIGYNRTLGTALNLLGEIHFATGQNALALEYYRISLQYILNAKSDGGLSQTFLNLAKLFETTGNKDSTIYYASRSISLSGQKGFLKEKRDAARFLSLYYRNKNSDSAFYYQDVSKATNDSLFNHQKQSQLQSLAFNEKLRQQEIATAALKVQKERKHNLQDVIIIIGLIIFILLFLLLSRSIVVKTKFIEFFGILGLLAVFEFINLFIHPYLSNATGDSHFFMLLILIAIGALLIPLHHKLEKWITGIMIAKNKKLRLEAAKKTISNLEGENS